MFSDIRQDENLHVNNDDINFLTPAHSLEIVTEIKGNISTKRYGICSCAGNYKSQKSNFSIPLKHFILVMFLTDLIIYQVFGEEGFVR